MAKRDGYLGNLIDRHNMLWNKFVWLENLSQKRRKGEPNRHLNGTTLNKYVNLHKKGTGWDYMIRGMDAQSIQALIQRRDVSFDKFFKYAKEKKEGKNPQKKESRPSSSASREKVRSRSSRRGGNWETAPSPSGTSARATSTPTATSTRVRWKARSRR